MSKRLLKLHKRKVARAKINAKTSEPDLRTPEQIKAARDASRASVGRDVVSPRGGAPALGRSRPTSMGGGTKTDV